jgi:hypothetical protein
MRTIRSEDTIAKKPAHGTLSGPKTKVAEFCRQNCLDILRLTRHDQGLTHELERLRVLLRRQVALTQAFEHFSVKSLLFEETELVESQYGVELAPLRSWFASHLPFEPLHLDKRDDQSSKPDHDDKRQSHQSNTIWIHLVLL